MGVKWPEPLDDSMRTKVRRDANQGRRRTDALTNPGFHRRGFASCTLRQHHGSS